MDIRLYAVAIILIVAILGYFVFIAPKNPNAISSSIPTTSIPVTNTINQTNSSTTNNIQTNYSQANRTWVQSKTFPIQIGNSNCVIIANVTYCVGGCTGNKNYTSSSYYSSVNKSGARGWNETIPAPIIPTSCLTYLIDVYCVTGKLLSNHDVINTTYYAYANNSGLSQWNVTTPYPRNISTHGCATSGFVIYCVGGIAGNGSLMSLSYYAPISKNGIGQWSSTTPLPAKANPQCYTYAYTIYCLGSYVYNGMLQNFNFYAPITSTGIQSWKSTKAAPNDPNSYSCSFYSPFVYCVGGKYNFTNSSPVYYTGLSIGGVNGWHQAPSYQFPVTNGTSCTTYNNTSVCVGGRLSNSSYINNTYYTRSFI